MSVRSREFQSSKMSKKNKRNKQKSRQGDRRSKFLGGQYQEDHSSRSGMTVYRSPATQLLPDVFVTKLKYSERVTLAATGGIFVPYQFSGGSVYDPNITSTGGVPEGYAIMSSMYTNYRVVGATIVAKFACVGTSNATSISEVAISAQPNTTVPLSMEAITSAPYSSWYVGPLTNNPIPSLRRHMESHKLFGVQADAILDAPSYTGLTGSIGTGSNPVNNWCFNIGVQSADRTSSITALVFVKITYDVEFFSRVTLTSQA